MYEKKFFFSEVIVVRQYIYICFHKLWMHFTQNTDTQVTELYVRITHQNYANGITIWMLSLSTKFWLI